jgi:hypothetical protein
MRSIAWSGGAMTLDESTLRLALKPPVTPTSFLYYFHQTIPISAIVTFAAHATNICYNNITTQKSADLNHTRFCFIAAVRVRYRHLYSFVTQYGC